VASLSFGYRAAPLAASRIEPGFPDNMYAKELARTFAYGGLRDQILA